MAKKPQAEERLSPPADGRVRSGPFARNAFRVWIGHCEIGLCAVSAPHWGDGKSSDPALRPTMTLRRAVGQDRTLYAWRRRIASGTDDPRNVTVALLEAPGGKPVCAWDFANARPVRWSGPELDAFSGAVAFEELEISYEDIVWLDRP